MRPERVAQVWLPPALTEVQSVAPEPINPGDGSDPPAVLSPSCPVESSPQQATRLERMAQVWPPPALTEVQSVAPEVMNPGDASALPPAVPSPSCPLWS